MTFSREILSWHTSKKLQGRRSKQNCGLLGYWSTSSPSNLVSCFAASLDIFVYSLCFGLRRTGWFMAYSSASLLTCGLTNSRIFMFILADFPGLFAGLLSGLHTSLPTYLLNYLLTYFNIYSLTSVTCWLTVFSVPLLTCWIVLKCISYFLSYTFTCTLTYLLTYVLTYLL